MAADTSACLKKTRYSLTIDGQPLFIDIYPFMDQAIAEIMLVCVDADHHLPAPFRMIRDITDDPSYRNAALARLHAGKRL